MLFLLTNEEGRALLMAHAGSKTEADNFGRNHLPEFCGESIEIDAENEAAAGEFWQVRTVRVVNVRLDPDARPSSGRNEKAVSFKHTWVHGPRLPEEVESAGLLTSEDYRDLTLDHIARTCEVVVRLQIRKRA